MMRRVKDDDKNEKIIRALLKLPANRRCINCNTLVPLYVCTSFWTFVCSTCSGIHREFTHRVKSVSMAKFTSEEATSLMKGGNERAKEVYFKEWDWSRHSVPSNSNIDELRKFIKHVYVDRRYTGEKTVVGSPRTPKEVKREDSFTHRNGLHSMPCFEIQQQRCIERSESSGRNPRQDKESPKHGEHRRAISAYFEDEDDRIRGHISEIMKSEANRFSNRRYRTQNLDRRPSNIRHKALDSTKPREVRSLREILDRIPALKENGGSRPSNNSVQMQRTASAISRTGEVGGNFVEPRLDSLEHEKNIKCTNISKEANSPNALVGIDFDCTPEGNQSKTASNAKNADSVVRAAKAIDGALKIQIPNIRRMHSNVLTSSPASNSSTPKASLVSAAFPLNTSEANHVKQEQGIRLPPSSRFPNTAVQPTFNVPSGGPNLQSQQIPQAGSEAVLKPLPSLQTLNGKKEFVEGHGTGPALHSEPSNQNSTGRKELPEHLFAATNSSAPFQSVQAHGMGYGLQHSPPVQVSTVYQPAISTNNFHSNKGTHLKSPMLFSSDSNSQYGATQRMPAQSSAYGAVPFQPSSGTPGMPLSSYMVQQLNHKLPPAGYEEVEVWGNNPTVFTTLINTGQQPSGQFSNPAIQRPFSSTRRNPFNKFFRSNEAGNPYIMRSEF